jgi:3-isopropylmalate/(R)-2-methylmalate dehydratase large subunit
MAKPRTLYDKIWEDHLVDEQPDSTCLIYIDRHLVHEVTSPQAFEGLPALRPQGARARQDALRRRPQRADHLAACPIPTRKARRRSPISRRTPSCSGSNISTSSTSARASSTSSGGQGFTLPASLVCGDSHTATHGAFGALAYGISTSGRARAGGPDADPVEVEEHALAVVDGKLPPGVAAKDIILAIIGEIGTASGTGYALEYAGRGDPRSVDGRPHDGVQHVGRRRRQGQLHRAGRESLFTFLKDRPKSPKGKMWDEPCATWETLTSDDGAHFDREIRLDAANSRRWSLGHQPRAGNLDHRPRAGAVEITDENKRAPPRPRSAMGLKGRREGHRHRDRSRVHRLLHQWPHRGFARGSQGWSTARPSNRASTR